MYALIHHYYCILFTRGNGIINHHSGCFFNLGNTVNRIYKWISSFSESSYINFHVSALISPYLYHTWYCIILDLRDLVLHAHRVRDSQWKHWGLASCQGLKSLRLIDQRLSEGPVLTNPRAHCGLAVSLTLPAPPRERRSTWRCSSGLLPLGTAGLRVHYPVIRVEVVIRADNSGCFGEVVFGSRGWVTIQRCVSAVRAAYCFCFSLVFKAPLYFRIKCNAFTLSCFLNMVEYCWNIVLQYLCK